MKRMLVIVSLALLGSLLPTVAHAESRCFASENTRERRLMRGNLDGDGIRDAVWVGARKFRTCHYYLKVDTSSAGKSRVRLPAPDKLSRYSLRNDARPIALVRIDSIPGREIAVKLLQGASVRPFGFFTIRSGALVRMDIEDEVKPLAAENMFAFGGGLSMMFATDCAFDRSERTVVFSRAYPSSDRGSRYTVERRWYQVQGDDFVRTTHPTQTEVVPVEAITRRFPEFKNEGLLPHCDGRVLDSRQA